MKSYTKSNLEDALTIDAPLLKVVGAAGTGKTEFLVQKASSLIEAGIAPERIGVVVSSNDAKAAFRKRLAAIRKEASAVSVMTLFQLCLAVLDTPEAREATERVARVLNDAEYKILLEDMKTLGQQPSRLRKMLNYFYYQWGQLEPESEWLLPREEGGVRKALDGYLRVRKAMIREEVAPLAADFLRTRKTESPLLGFDHLLVDDLQNYSKASQVVCQELGTQCFIVTGNENQSIEGFDPYPYPEGFTDLEDALDGVECVQLTKSLRGPAAVTAAGNALCAQGSQDPTQIAEIEGPLDKKAITQIKWGSPEEELAGLSFMIKALFDEDPELDPSEVYVVVPNRVWARAFKRDLERYGICLTTVLDGQPLSGDPRASQKASMLIAYTKLNLVADPDDVVAWRSWCGFDDHLCYSGAWARLQEWALSQNIEVLDALKKLGDLSENPFLEADVLKERYLSGSAVVEALKDKKGFQLVRALVDEQGSAGFADLLEPVMGDESAAELFEKLSSQILEATFDDLAQKIRIGSYRHLRGLNPKIVIMSGLIDGFMPSRNCFDAAILEEERERELDVYRRVFYNALTKPAEKLILSTLQKADLEMAESLKMEVRRVRMIQGKRMAMLSPSTFIDEAGDAIPGAVSGEQYLGMRR